MATTTNYSWSTPDDTALVKDGAAAIRSLGTAIDTTVFTNAGAAIAKSTVDAKGDLIAGTADNTVSRLAVGTNGYTLVADSSEVTGLKWAAPASTAFKGVRCTVANQNISNGVDQVVLFTTETFDEGGYHSNATNTGRLTVPAGEAGYYNIYFVMQWQNGATGSRSIQIQINGVTNTTAVVILPDATQYLTCAGSTTYYLGVGDYAQIAAFQNRGSSLQIDGGTFGMNKVG